MTARAVGPPTHRPPIDAGLRAVLDHQEDTAQGRRMDGILRRAVTVRVVCPHHGPCGKGTQTVDESMELPEGQNECPACGAPLWLENATPRDC